MVKAIFDGLNGVLWRDDVLVVDLRVRKRYAATPCVRVEVWAQAEPVLQVSLFSRKRVVRRARTRRDLGQMEIST